MTKQRIGVLAVCMLLAAAGVGQTPPAKQMAVEKKSRGAARNMLVMPGSEQWMDIPAAVLVGTPSVEMGGTVKRRGSCEEDELVLLPASLLKQPVRLANLPLGLLPACQ